MYILQKGRKETTNFPRLKESILIDKNTLFHFAGFFVCSVDLSNTGGL